MYGEDFWSSINRSRAASLLDPQAVLEELCVVLERMDIRSAVATFNGGGDSGCVEEMEVHKTDGSSMEVPEEGLWRELYLALERFLPSGWENNSGGYGTITLDVESREADVDFNEHTCGDCGESEDECMCEMCPGCYEHLDYCECVRCEFCDEREEECDCSDQDEEGKAPNSSDKEGEN